MMTELVWIHGGVTDGGRDFSKWFKTRLALTRQPSRMKLTFEEERKLLLEDELGGF